MTAHTLRLTAAGITDAWRGNALNVEQCLRFIKQHQRTIDGRNERLSTGRLVRNRRDVAHARQTLAFRLKRYLESVRAVSEYEARMEAIGMRYARSSDHWLEDELLSGMTTPVAEELDVWEGE